MKAHEDFFLTVLHAHVVAAANHLLESLLVRADKCKVEDMAKEIIIRFVYFDPNVKINTADKIFLYCLQVLILGMELTIPSKWKMGIES